MQRSEVDRYLEMSPFALAPKTPPALSLSQTQNCQAINLCPSFNTAITHTTATMKTAELSQLATGLAAPDFKAIEPHLIALDKHLILRTFMDGYSLSEADTKIWVTIRSNKVANAFLKRGALPNLARWFNYIEQTHPEIQEEIKAKDEAEKARKANLSKAGASYNMALQDVEKGVVTRFPPEPSYVSPKIIVEQALT